MRRSRLKKTSWYSDSESPPAPTTRGADRPQGQTQGPGQGQTQGRGAAPPLVELQDVSLRFVAYTDKQYSVKRAALNLLMRRDAPQPSTDFWALRNVDLKLRQGDRLAVIGSNGAGKSTLLRVLARIYPATSGRVTIRGSVAPLIEMGAGFNPELSGTDNIYLNGAMLGFRRKEMLARVDSIHEFTGLADFADLPLKYYSSGMYMRLAFAIATEVNPDVLLVDESLGVGDAAFLDRARARIHRLLDRTQVVVIVSHDLKSLRNLCNRAILLNKGQIVDGGPVDDVVDRYLAGIKTSWPAAAMAPKSVPPAAGAPHPNAPGQPRPAGP